MVILVRRLRQKHPIINHLSGEIMENNIKSWRRVLAILINAIFFCIQIAYFCNVAPYAPTKWFQYLFIIGGCIFIVWCWIIIQHVDQLVSVLDNVGLFVIAFSMVCICFLIFMVGPFSMMTAWVTGMITILIGIIGKVKSRAFSCQIYCLWGIYVLLWTSNWYNSVY